MKYHITSTSWSGFIEVIYNELGYLVSHSTQNAELNETQQKWFLNRMPRELVELQRIISGSTAKIEEVKLEVTFDLFWNRYDEKIRSSKKKAQLAWNRLAEPDRQKAYAFIPKYKKSIPQGVSVKYAETYLHSEIWNN